MARAVCSTGQSITTFQCGSNFLETDIEPQLFPACFLSLLVFTPESPRWLVLRGRDDEAIESLRRYLGKGLSAEDPIVQDEYKSIKAAVMIEKEANVSLKEVVLCRDRSSHLRRMLLGMGKWICWSGRPFDTLCLQVR